MSNFEDHLWREVERQHDPDLEPSGRPPTRHRRLAPRILAAAGILGLAGVGTAVALALGAASASPAFAVTRHPDGTVTVWVKRSSGIAGANAKLHQLGIRATVLPQAPVRCGDLPITQQGDPAPNRHFTKAYWTIDRKIPAGKMLALTPAPAPSLTPAPGPADNANSSDNTVTAGNSGTATTSGGRGPAPSVNWQTPAGKVWTCSVPVGPTPGPGAGNTGTSTGTSTTSGNSSNS